MGVFSFVLTEIVGAIRSQRSAAGTRKRIRFLQRGSKILKLNVHKNHLFSDSKDKEVELLGCLTMSFRLNFLLLETLTCCVL